jgi:hypothetical protein
MPLVAHCSWRGWRNAFGLLKTSRVQVVGALLTLVVQLGLAGYLHWLRPWG